jgi:hypothetical protein
MARNSGGTYSLPSSPVITGTPIAAARQNSLESDLATELTDSLDRSGKGGMLAPLRVPDGTVAAPSMAFTGETGSGLYRIGAADVALSVNGTKRQEWTSTGALITGTLGVSGVASETTANSSLSLKGNRDAADTGTDVVLGSIATRSNGNLVDIQNNGSSKASVDYTGILTAAGLVLPIATITRPSIAGTWVNGAGDLAFGYWKDSENIVHLVGTANWKTGASTTIVTLPSGFRPKASRTFPNAVFNTSAYVFGAVVVGSGGAVAIQSSTNNYDYYFDGITFLGEQ